MVKLPSSTTLTIGSPLPSVTAPRATNTGGLWWGFLGVAAFSLTVPLTRVVVQYDAMSPLFVGAGRAVLAAVLAR